MPARGHVVEDVELPVVAQGLADVEGEIGAPVGDVHVLDAGARVAAMASSIWSRWAMVGSSWASPWAEQPAARGKEEQKAEGSRMRFIRVTPFSGGARGGTTSGAQALTDRGLPGLPSTVLARQNRVQIAKNETESGDQ